MRFAGCLAAGDLGARLQPPPGPEFGALADSLNRMADALQRARAEQAEQALELQRLNRALRVLSQCNETLVRTDNEAELVQRICRHVVEAGGYRLAWVGYARHDAARSVEAVAMAGVDPAYVEQLRLSWGEETQRQGIADVAVRDAGGAGLRRG
jgi:nitrate/nitrite-specific signal transduction histidine kinase